MQNLPTTLPDWLALLESRHAETHIDMGLDRVRAVKDRMNLRFDCPVIMVAGTNGKGSTCAMLESILLHGGYRVGLYIKPHFLDFNERARINGEMASDAALIASFDVVEAARGDIDLTYFEFTTLAIAHLLSTSPIDVAILEVGLGGRLDAVNVIEPDVSIVTSIDIDHKDYLGDTREQIGFEKAGIFRAGKPAICSDPQPPQSLIQHAADIGADLWLIGRDFNYQGDQQQWAYGGRSMRRNSLAYPALRGANQLLNARPRWPRSKACACSCRSGRRKRAPAWRWWSCRAVSRCWRDARPRCSTSPTIRTRPRRCPRTCPTWATTATRMRCSGSCRTRTSTPSSSISRPTSTTGACAGSIRRARPTRPCWPASWKRSVRPAPVTTNFR
jgi:hypothetical protein